MTGPALLRDAPYPSLTGWSGPCGRCGVHWAPREGHQCAWGALARIHAAVGAKGNTFPGCPALNRKDRMGRIALALYCWTMEVAS